MEHNKNIVKDNPMLHRIPTTAITTNADPIKDEPMLFSTNPTFAFGSPWFGWPTAAALLVVRHPMVETLGGSTPQRNPTDQRG